MYDVRMLLWILVYLIWSWKDERRSRQYADQSIESFNMKFPPQG